MLTISPDFGSYLKRLRREHQMTQSDLAEKAHYSVDFISMLERGVRPPTIMALEVLADALGLSSEERQAFWQSGKQQRQQPGDAPRPTPLPLPPNPLLGRDAEIRQGLDLLTVTQARIVTVTGTAGVGKTHFALELASQASSHFADDVLFVDLTTLDQPDLLLSVVAARVGVHERRDVPLRDLLVNHLRDRQMLWVLDNFEQIAAAGRELAEIVALCPQLSVLVTSRVALHLRAERLLELAPLPIPASQQGVAEQGAIATISAAPGQVVTLAGAGAVERRRMAYVVVEALRRQGTGVVQFLSSAEIADLTSPDAPGRQDLFAALGNQNALLVVDYGEQQPTDHALISAVLERCPGALVLVCSPAPLRRQGERTILIPALRSGHEASLADLEDALRLPSVELFRQRATAVRPQFAITPENLPAIIEICRHLDGLPLALELAAARVKMLSPDQVLQQLLTAMGGASLTMLLAPTAAPGDRDERHRTLNSAIGWSYALLPPGQQRLFCAMCVFGGAIHFEELSAFCAGLTPSITTIAGDLEGLVENHLVTIQWGDDTQSTYGVLEALRDFGLTQLRAEGQEAATYHQLVQSYLSLAERAEAGLQGPDQIEWLRLLNSEHDNLRVALRWTTQGHDSEEGLRIASALKHFWYDSNYISEGRAWLTSLLGQYKDTTQPSDLWQTKALLVAAYLAGHQRENALGIDLAESALSLEEAMNNKEGIAQALSMIGILAARIGRHQEAQTSLQRTLVLWQELENDTDMARTLHDLGIAAYYRGDLLEAAQWYRQEVTLRETLKDVAGQAEALKDLGGALRNLGEYEEAEQCLADCERMFSEQNNDSKRAMALNNLGQVYWSQGKLEQAQVAYEKCLFLKESAGDQRSLAITLTNLGVCLRLMQDYSEARARLERSLLLLANIQDFERRAYAEISLGELELELGHVALAADHFCQGLRAYAAMNDVMGIVEAAEAFAHLATVKGDAKEATHWYAACMHRREDAHKPLAPVQHPQYERDLVELHHHLAPDQFASAWEAGWSERMENVMEWCLRIYGSAEPGGAQS